MRMHITDIRTNAKAIVEDSTKTKVEKIVAVLELFNSDISNDHWSSSYGISDDDFDCVAEIIAGIE